MADATENYINARTWYVCFTTLSRIGKFFYFIFFSLQGDGEIQVMNQAFGSSRYDDVEKTLATL